MKILFCFLFIVSWSLSSLAQGPEKEVTVLKEFASCVKDGADMEALGKCTKAFFTKDLSQQQRKRLLRWFLSHPKIAFGPCDEKMSQRAQRKYPDGDIKFVCAAEGASPKSGKATLFILKTIDGKPQLLNVSL